jgi:hypothetical protein
MRTVAALCLVGVVLFGGVVIGAVITDGGSGDAVPDLGATDEGTHSGAADHSTPTDERREGYHESGPEEDYQQGNNSTNNSRQNNQETATPTPTPEQEQQTPTPTPERQTATPTPTRQQTATPTPTRQQTATPTPTPTPEPTPTPTEDDDGSGFPIFGGDDDDDGGDEPTPTPTPEPTPTPGPGQETSTPNGSAQFEVVDATVGKNAVEVGEYVEVSAMVENRGSEGGTYEAELWVDGRVVQLEPVYVPAQSVDTVAFQVQFEEPGEYDIAVSGTEAGTVAVEERQIESDGGIEVIDAVLPADAVRPGVETNVRATVENPNDRPVNGTLVVTIDDEPVREVDVSLEAGERTEVSIPFEAQEGTVAVNGVEAGQLNIRDDIGSGNEADEEGPTERAGLRFGILAAIVVVLGAISVAAAVHWQRYDETPLEQIGRDRP